MWRAVYVCACVFSVQKPSFWKWIKRLAPKPIKSPNIWWIDKSFIIRNIYAVWWFLLFLHWVAACRFEIKQCVCANVAHALGFVINIIGYRCWYPKVCCYAANCFMHNKWVLQLVPGVPRFFRRFFLLLVRYIDTYALFVTCLQHVYEKSSSLTLKMNSEIW